MSYGVRTRDGSFSFPIHTTHPTIVPYLRHGSAGIGMVLLRYLAALHDERYQNWLDDIWGDLDRKYSISPARFFGLTGIAEFFVDAMSFGFRSADARKGVDRVLSGLELYGLSRSGGLAFPGQDLLRITCDVATGSSGILLLLARLKYPGPQLLFVDELLASATNSGQMESDAIVVNGAKNPTLIKAAQ